jgi:hypothetical protein
MWNLILYWGLRAATAAAQGQAPGGGGTGQNPGSVTSTITIPNPLSCTNLNCLVLNIIDKLLLLAMPVVTLMVLVGAFQILTAAGNSEKVSTGRKTIQYAVLGFVLLLLSKGFVYVIADVLGGRPAVSPPAATTFPTR